MQSTSISFIFCPLIFLGTKFASAVRTGSSDPAQRQACMCNGDRVLSSCSAPGMHVQWVQGALIPLQLLACTYVLSWQLSSCRYQQQCATTVCHQSMPPFSLYFAGNFLAAAQTCRGYHAPVHVQVIDNQTASAKPPESSSCSHPTRPLHGQAVLFSAINLCQAH